MKMFPRYYSIYFIALVTVLFLSSCQKEVDIDLPEPGIEPGTKLDSAQLIKSIGIVFYGDITTPLSGTDSIIETYNYDTVAKKINITWEATSNYQISGGASFLYNADSLLSLVEYKGSSVSADDYASMAIEYDEANVLKVLRITKGDGSVERKDFLKVPLASGGYTLSWDEPLEDIKRKAWFTTAGLCIKHLSDYTYAADTDPSGADIYTSIITTDSFAYDATNSVTKVYRNRRDTLRKTEVNFIPHEFLARQTKGDQLYLQRRALLNGVGNMPFSDEDDWYSGNFGILSLFLSPIEHMQYMKHPIQSSRVYDETSGTFSVINTPSVYDTKDRLVSFRGYFEDLNYPRHEFKIVYYK
jgi:hypothetical protein